MSGEQSRGPLELLRLVRQRESTGCLSLHQDGEEVRIYFEGGRVISVSCDLREVLTQAGKLSSELGEQIAQGYRPSSQKGWALLLEDASYVAREEVLRLLEEAGRQGLHLFLAGSEEGFFFEEGIRPPEGSIPLDIGLEDFIREGEERRPSPQPTPKRGGFLSRIVRRGGS